MNNKKLRNILTIFWGMLLCINLFNCLINPTPINWICSGFMSGGLFIMFLDHQIMNLQEDFINSLIKHNKSLCSLIDRLNKRKKKK